MAEIKFKKLISFCKVCGAPIFLKHKDGMCLDELDVLRDLYPEDVEVEFVCDCRFNGIKWFYSNGSYKYTYESPVDTNLTWRNDQWQ